MKYYSVALNKRLFSAPAHAGGPYVICLTIFLGGQLFSIDVQNAVHVLQELLFFLCVFNAR